MFKNCITGHNSQSADSEINLIVEQFVENKTQSGCIDRSDKELERERENTAHVENKNNIAAASVKQKLFDFAA